MATKKIHWLQNPNKNYLGHWDLPADKDLILTIKSANWENVKNPVKNTVKLKRVVRFEENYKPLICNETNAKSIYLSTGRRYLEESAGAKIALYIGTTKDKFTNTIIDCIRIRNEKVTITKPKLTPQSDKWEQAKKSKLSLNELRKHYDITDDDYKKLRDIN